MMHHNSSSGHLQGRGSLARVKDFAGTMPGMLVVTIATMALVYLMFAQL